MKDLISVIIPVYNVEKYLEKCLESVVKQTYQNLEIIIVNDGSTDNSRKIIDKYQKNDKRIKVINQKNGGLSLSRNKGLDLARGKYISFVDSDDYLELDMIEYLYNNLIKYKADLSICGFNSFDNQKIIKKATNKISILTKEEALLGMIKYDNKICTCAWNKLYKKELFNNNYYEVGKFYEDIIPTFNCLIKSKRIVYGDTCKYNYLIKRSDSITNLKYTKHDLDRVDASFIVYEKIIKKFPKLSDDYLTFHMINRLASCNKLINKNINNEFIKDSRSFIRKNYKSILKSKYSFFRKSQLLVFAFLYPLYQIYIFMRKY